MNLLAIDTATEICGVALVEDGKVTGELILDGGTTHTRTVMQAVQALLSVHNRKPSDIDCLGVTRGPGSFTGLRIGISTVKGLAVAMGRPLVSVSSLEVIAHQAPAGTPLVCSVLDARRQEVYWSLYRRFGDKWTAEGVEHVGRADDIAAHIDDECTFIGNGVPLYRDVIEGHLRQPGVFVAGRNNAIRPSVLARLCWCQYKKGKGNAVGTFAPVYLRKSDAELNKW
jgi:tRNA threonylcarbamoyladenosine biosynthesis protein TsaB